MSGDTAAAGDVLAGLTGSGLPERVGVLGGGTMGAGIAHAMLLGGARVTVADADEQRAAAARTRVVDAVHATEQRGKLSEPVDAVLARLDAGVGAAALSRAGLVVEAVPENPALKARVLADLDAALAPGAVLATNTSSIGIGELGLSVAPARPFLGLHFFNPVPASALVEVVRGPATTDALVERARGWVTAMGKTSVVVADSPGFASSRLGLALGLEAIRMVEAGVASAEDVDAAMVLGYKHPMGPLRLTDVVGLDVRLGIAEHLASTLGPRFEPPDLLRAMVADGLLGRKSGRGFYDW